MKERENQAPLHTGHVKWGLRFSDGRRGTFGWEGPDQVRHRFYELYRDAIHQGNDYSPYRIDIRPGSPEEFIKLITDDRMESYRETFAKIYSQLAEENGSLDIEMGGGASKGSMTLRAVTDLHPFQITFKTGVDPVIEALLVHIVYSHLEGCRIRRCDNCHEIFLREGKKPRLDERVYCGSTCTRAAVTKRYLSKRKAKTDAAKEAAAAAAKETDSRSREKPAPPARPAKKKTGKSKR